LKYLAFISYLRALTLATALAALSPMAHAQKYITVILQPTTLDSSGANGISEGNIGGSGRGAITGNQFHSLLWSATGTIIDLHPTGFTESSVRGVSGDKQVGSGSTPPTGVGTHALLWSGTAASVIDLHPTGFFYSEANAVSGNTQVGHGHIEKINNTGFRDISVHALLWSGTAASVVDLNPMGFRYSWANAVSGNTQVGNGFTSTGNHALLWSGTAASVVDLNPIGLGFSESVANGVSGNTQVGSGRIGTKSHALLWSGTAASAVDLHPTGFELCGFRKHSGRIWHWASNR
jgi:hypothetical protein